MKSIEKPSSAIVCDVLRMITKKKNRILISSNGLHLPSVSVRVVIIEPSITVTLNGN